MTMLDISNPNARLVAMVNEGKSDIEIAAALGITHNAVVGRRWRLNLAPGAPRQFSRTAPKSAPLSKKLLAAFAPPGVAIEPRECPTVDILGLTSMTCRWPIGDNPADPGFQYCGAPKETGPYCSAHGAMAYTPRGIDKVRRDAAREARL